MLKSMNISIQGYMEVLHKVCMHKQGGQKNSLLLLWGPSVFGQNHMMENLMMANQHKYLLFQDRRKV